MISAGKARAHSNIALIKYWGKMNENLALPMNSSLSFTLDCFYTETEVIYDENIQMDLFYLDGVIQSQNITNSISKFLDMFRDVSSISSKAIVKSTNFVPTAAGLASSASGFAALTAAASIASGLELSHKELSIYARKGSGSAARSIFGGFVQWNKGTGDESSYAFSIDDGNWDIGMIIVIVNSSKKPVSSREGMKRTVETSPFYKGWLDSVDDDLDNIKLAIKNKDIEQIGSIAERNALKMHATMLGANPPLLYWEPDTMTVMQLVQELRQKGIECYFTMDAGPNVKIICRLSESNIIKERLLDNFDSEQILITGAGPGVAVI